MTRKTVIRFDDDSLPMNKMQIILNNNSNLKALDSKSKIYSFEFDDNAFLHASLLLGQNPQRFGYDLSYYLHFLPSIFKNIKSDYIVLDFGSADFKRRASEDLGVGIAALFMVKSFKIRWEKIFQIPANKKLSRYTPDFEATASNGKQYIFEAKGRTSPHKMEETITKAVSQIKAYQRQNEGKFAIVSYFPTSKKLFPSFTFVVDPSQPENIFELDEEDKLLLHYRHALEFSALLETMSVLTRFLSQKIKSRMSKKEGRLPFPKDEFHLDKLRDTLVHSLMREAEGLEKLKFDNFIFIGKRQRIEVGEIKIELFRGIEREIINRIIRFDKNIEYLEDRIIDEEDKKISIFSDGTILYIHILHS